MNHRSHSALPERGARYRTLTCSMLVAALPATALADALDDIGYRQLLTETAGQLPRGTSVRIDQVEASLVSDPANPVYRADPAHPDFTGVSFVDQSMGPSPAFSGHANGVARQFAGNSSMTAEVAIVDSYEVNHWLTSVLYGGGISPARPLRGTGLLANHSWVGGLTDTALAGDLLGRLDWLVDQDDYVQVVGVTNGTQVLLGHAYNVIGVSNTSGPIGVLTSAVDAFYVAGRPLPQLVAPSGSVSEAVPLVTATVALLRDSAPASPLPPALAKALLMAGADRRTRNSSTVNLASYTVDTLNGLDRRYGAGQLNVRNSYLLYAAPRSSSDEEGGTSDRGYAGHAYDAAFGGADGSNAIATYPLGTATTSGTLAATLAWHADLVDPAGTFAPSRSLRNLNLELLDTSGANAVLVARSASSVDNSENVWTSLTRGRHYSLRVTRTGTATSRPYALAWRLEPDQDADGLDDRFESGTCPAALDADSDDDGIADGAEDADANGVSTGETSPCLADTDADGLADGMEAGVTSGVADPDGAGPLTGTGAGFVGDADAGTRSNPLLADSDGDGIDDGIEDANRNGRVDTGESDPGDPQSVPAQPQRVPFPLGALTVLAAALGSAAMHRLSRQRGSR